MNGLRVVSLNTFFSPSSVHSTSTYIQRFDVFMFVMMRLYKKKFHPHIICLQEVPNPKDFAEIIQSITAILEQYGFEVHQSPNTTNIHTTMICFRRNEFEVIRRERQPIHLINGYRHVAHRNLMLGVVRNFFYASIRHIPSQTILLIGNIHGAREYTAKKSFTNKKQSDDVQDHQLELMKLNLSSFQTISTLLSVPHIAFLIGDFNIKCQIMQKYIQLTTNPWNMVCSYKDAVDYLVYDSQYEPYIHIDSISTIDYKKQLAGISLSDHFIQQFNIVIKTVSSLSPIQQKQQDIQQLQRLFFTKTNKHLSALKHRCIDYNQCTLLADPEHTAAFTHPCPEEQPCPYIRDIRHNRSFIHLCLRTDCTDRTHLNDYEHPNMNPPNPTCQYKKLEDCPYRHDKRHIERHECPDKKCLIMNRIGTQPSVFKRHIAAYVHECPRRKCKFMQYPEWHWRHMRMYSHKSDGAHGGGALKQHDDSDKTSRHHGTSASIIHIRSLHQSGKTLKTTQDDDSAIASLQYSGGAALKPPSATQGHDKKIKSMKKCFAAGDCHNIGDPQHATNFLHACMNQQHSIDLPQQHYLTSYHVCERADCTDPVHLRRYEHPYINTNPDVRMPCISESECKVLQSDAPANITRHHRKTFIHICPDASSCQIMRLSDDNDEKIRHMTEFRHRCGRNIKKCKQDADDVEAIKDHILYFTHPCAFGRKCIYEKSPVCNWEHMRIHHHKSQNTKKMPQEKKDLQMPFQKQK